MELGFPQPDIILECVIKLTIPFIFSSVIYCLLISREKIISILSSLFLPLFYFFYVYLLPLSQIIK